MATTKGEVNLGTIKLAKTILSTCLKAVGKTYIIIDGIDECQPSEQQHIAKFWMTYVESSGADPESSRCAFFGQEDASTRPMFCKLPTIRIQGKDHDSDIHSYCYATARERLEPFALTTVELSEIVSQVSCRADGMFLFARLVISNLSEQVNREGLEAEMAPTVFPTGLKEAYARITQRILVQAPSSYRKHAQRLLSWVCCATRPLKWREIQAAVSIDLGRRLLDFDRYRLRVDAKALCGALIEELPNGDVSFVHSTVKQFLLQSPHVNAAAEHTSLTELCLGYLSLPAFSAACTNDELRASIITGTYAFTEYAIIAWTAHLEAVLGTSADAPFPRTLFSIVDDFFQKHWKKPTKRSKPTKRIHELTSHIAHLGIHDKTRDSMSSMHCLMSTNLADAKPVQTLDLFEFLARIRFGLEKMAADADVVGPLEHFYGIRLYKCPRIYCKWFYEGFLTAHERELHVEKHERSYLCSAAGCIYQTLGFPAANQLAAHVATYHQTGPSEEEFPAIVDESDPSAGDMADVEPSAPIEQHQDAATDNQDADMDNQHAATGSRGQREDQSGRAVKPLTRPMRQNVPERRRQAGPSTNQCQVCSKTFSRAFTLQSHMRTHTGERPHKCNVCGKQFARVRDCRRHKRSHRGKAFACEGILPNGDAWGCGMRFARADALGRHSRTCRESWVGEEVHRQAAATGASSNEPSADRARWLPTIGNLIFGSQEQVPATEHATE